MSDTATKTALKVIKKLSKLGPGGNTAVVTLESENEDHPRAIEELQGMAARTTATAWAAENGLANPLIDGVPTSPHAVNSKGEVIDEVREKNTDLEPTDPRLQVHRYRIEVNLTRRMV